MMNLWMTNRQQWTDKINKDLLTKAENHEKEIKKIREHYEKELKLKLINSMRKQLKLIERL